MTETTQSERRVLRGHTAKGRPGDSIPLSRKMIGKLVNDADRLAQAEKLLKRARPFDGPGADAEDVVLAAEIDSFTSDGGQ